MICTVLEAQNHTSFLKAFPRKFSDFSGNVRNSIFQRVCSCNEIICKCHRKSKVNWLKYPHKYVKFCFIMCESVQGKSNNHVSAYHIAQFVSPSTCHDCVRVCSAYEGKEDSASRIHASVLATLHLGVFLKTTPSTQHKSGPRLSLVHWFSCDSLMVLLMSVAYD